MRALLLSASTAAARNQAAGWSSAAASQVQTRMQQNPPLTCVELLRSLQDTVHLFSGDIPSAGGLRQGLLESCVAIAAAAMRHRVGLVGSKDLARMAATTSVTSLDTNTPSITIGPPTLTVNFWE